MSYRTGKVPHQARATYHLGVALTGVGVLLMVFLVHGVLHHGREIVAHIVASPSALHLAGSSD